MANIVHWDLEKYSERRRLINFSQNIWMFDWGSLVAFLLAFVLYILTLAPTIFNLDSAELTTAVATGGIVRATGYPLYLVLGSFWKFLPIGDLGYRMNLFSAFWGATTIFLAARILRQLNVAPWIRLAALGLLATAPFFWAMSLIAEVYTLHTALMAGVILSLMIWAKSPSPFRLALPVLLVTLSMGNHAATVLIIPGCIWFVVSQHPQQLMKPRVLIAALLAILVGGTIFLYIPWQFGHNPAFNYAGVYDSSGQFVPVDLQSLDGFLWLVTGKAFSGQMFAYRWTELWPEIKAFGEQLWAAFFIIGLGPGLLGMFVLIKKSRSLGGMFLLIFLANAVFYINYRVIDKNTMYLPTFLIWALWLGVGYQVMVEWIRGLNTSRALNWAFMGFTIGAVLFAAVWNWERVDLSGDWSTRDQSEEILKIVEPDSIVFGWWDIVPGIQYLQLVEGRRPDVKTYNRFLISAQDMNQLILDNIDEHSVYINNPSIQLLNQVNATKVGPLFRLESRE